MIVGHKKEREILRKIFESGKIPHAFLFSGPEGVGKKKMAFEFASWVLGQNLSSHPDFFFVQPINGKIQIDQIRDLSWKISLRPFLGKKKVVILDSAHLMTKEAQNCFLKTLEEPKGESLIILVSEYPNLLLPTILSRCQEIKFSLVSKSEIREFLAQKKVPPEKAEKILKFSFGKIGKVVEFLADEKKLEKIENLDKELEKVPKLSFSERFQLVKKWLADFEVEEILKISLFHYREVFLSQEKKEEKSTQILEKIQRLYLLNLITNLDPKLILEILLLSF
jgi:DNA polymerase-3 subunit delta'